MREPAGEGRIEDVPEHRPVIERRMIHEGRVWNVAWERFDYDGTPIVRELVDHPGAVAVLALDDEERALLIRQYRHPIHARVWEIPAGLLDGPGESALTAAQRELGEEADLAAERWNVLADFQNSPGGSDETIRVYLARGISTLPAFARHDEEADIETRWVPLDDVVDAILHRRVQSPSLAVGALAAVAARSRGWDTLAPGDEPWLRHPRLGGAPWVLPGDRPETTP
ncbi:NUDIX domain-containing protein [Amnibacterium sp.]|jgi:ADP-ribose pyrophosphatase|uniref:NUDIX domain-containing protein n=1 Tax=Amnibacterium sp. TaxID=1872496 RepID=UPI0039C87EE9